MWSKVFDLGICFFEGYMYYTLWRHFLKIRTDNVKYPLAVLSISSVALFVINQFHKTYLNLIGAIILSAAACLILFTDSYKKKLFFVLLSSFVLVCCEFVVGGVFSVTLGEEALICNIDPVRVFLITISSKLLSFLVIRWICHVSGNGKSLFFSSLVPYFSVFPIACFVMFIGLTYSTMDFENMTFSTSAILLGCICLWLSNIVLFTVYDRMTYMMNRVKEYELTDFKTKLENQHYMQIEEINRKHSEIIHDMGNYMSTIESLALKENNEKIVDIINSVNRHILEVEEEYYCNYQIMNAILNGKRQEAVLKNVLYKVHVEIGFEKPDVEDIDLISIISNLLDNAIEAAAKCQKGFVDIQLYRVNDGRFTIFKVANNYVDKPLEKRGEFITRKKNPEMHGIGLRHVKSIVERYGGWTNIEYGNGEFCVTVMFA